MVLEYYLKQYGKSWELGCWGLEKARESVPPRGGGWHDGCSLERGDTKGSFEPDGIIYHEATKYSDMGETTTKCWLPDWCQLFVFGAYNTSHGFPSAAIYVIKIFCIVIQFILMIDFVFQRLATSLRFYYLVGMTGFVAVFLERWTNYIWPEIRG